MLPAKRIIVLASLLLAACAPKGDAEFLSGVAVPREASPNRGPLAIEPIFRPGVDKVFRCPTPGGSAVLVIPGAPECDRAAERLDADPRVAS